MIIIIISKAAELMNNFFTKDYLLQTYCSLRILDFEYSNDTQYVSYSVGCIFLIAMCNSVGDSKGLQANTPETE